MGRLNLGKRGTKLAARVRRGPAWLRYLVYALGVMAVIGLGSVIYLYISYARIIDARLNGERERSLPRVYARPFELLRGQSLSELELIARLNDLGYAQRARAEAPGEFAIGRNAVALTPRGGDLAKKTVQIGRAHV